MKWEVNFQAAVSAFSLEQEVASFAEQGLILWLAQLSHAFLVQVEGIPVSDPVTPRHSGDTVPFHSHGRD